MKHIYRFSFLFTLGFMGWFAYTKSMAFFYPPVQVQQEEEPRIIQNITVLRDESGKDTIVEQDDDVLDVSNTENKVTCDTVYIVRKLDNKAEEETEEEEELPDQYIGKKRQDIEELIRSYNDAPSLRDLEKGFASMELTSFSPEKIVVTKKYYSDLSDEVFYLLVESEYISVYYSDLKTVYLYTDILLYNLPDDLQQEILDKKLIETEEELYNFLESYSS